MWRDTRFDLVRLSNEPGAETRRGSVQGRHTKGQHIHANAMRVPFDLSMYLASNGFRVYPRQCKLGVYRLWQIPTLPDTTNDFQERVLAPMSEENGYCLTSRSFARDH